MRGRITDHQRPPAKASATRGKVASKGEEPGGREKGEEEGRRENSPGSIQVRVTGRETTRTGITVAAASSAEARVVLGGPGRFVSPLGRGNDLIDRDAILPRLITSSARRGRGLEVQSQPFPFTATTHVSPAPARLTAGREHSSRLMASPWWCRFDIVTDASKAAGTEQPIIASWLLSA